MARLDPVKMFLLQQPDPIPADVIEAMATELLPGARRQRWAQIIALALGFALVIGGNVIYFRYFSNWQGFDPVNTTIYIVQLLVLLSGPLLGMRAVRAAYGHRVVQVMLRHRHCPHCGYDLRALPVFAAAAMGGGERTTCPECGCTWPIDASVAARDRHSIGDAP